MGRVWHVIWPNKKDLHFSKVINNEPVLTSMLTGIVQDMFAGEAGEGERGRRSGDDWGVLLPPGSEILPVPQQLNFAYH